MSTMALSRVAIPMAIPPVRSRSQNRKENIMICLPTRFKPQRLHVKHFGTKCSPNVAVKNHTSLSICAAALSATCSSVQSTATAEKLKSKTPKAPPREKTPKLDPGGRGNPPTTGGGDGGGGGGEGPFSGGFFLFLFLIFLDFLKEMMEKKSEYQD